MEEARTIFEIPAANMKKFEAQIEKLSKRAVKLLGADMAIKPFVFSHDEKPGVGRVYSVLLNAQMPVLEGWTFVARLDHSNETGTIIRMVPNVAEIPERFRRAASVTCEHCNVNRYRRDTFVVREDATNEYKQVGSTCLQDFFGHDPYKIAKLAELLGYARECGRAAQEHTGEEVSPRDYRWLDVEEFLSYAAMVVRAKGWVSGKAAYENPRLEATREATWNAFGMRYNHAAPKPTAEDHALVADALKWADSLRQKDILSDYEHNISVIAGASMIENRSAGLAVSIVGIFYNNQQRALQASQRIERTVDLGDFKPVIALFNRASSKIQHPKIRLQLPDGKPIVLAVAGAKSKNPGTVNITDGRPFGENTWYGRVTETGVWDRSRSVSGPTMTSLTALLSALATDPAGTAAAYGKLTGQCCVCARPLSDPRSADVGYGQTCAKKLGWPWGAK